MLVDELLEGTPRLDEQGFRFGGDFSAAGAHGSEAGHDEPHEASPAQRTATRDPDQPAAFTLLDGAVDEKPVAARACERKDRSGALAPVLMARDRDMLDLTPLPCTRR